MRTQYRRHPLRRWTALAFVAAITAVSTSRAEEAADLPVSEEAVLFDAPVVLSASRLAQPRTEAPAAITVIDRDMIRESGARSVVELLRLVPGFQVSAVAGYRPVVTYHGFSDAFSRRMQVLVDGRSVYSSIIGGVFWSDIPLSMQDIDHIEVVRGSNSASYGSNAFQGVINIVTVHASQTRGSVVEVAGGSSDIRDGYARQGWKSGQSDWRLSASYQQDAGLKGVSSDWKKVPIVGLRGDMQLNQTDSLELQLGINGERHIEGFAESATEPYREVEVNSNFQQLRWRRALDAGGDVHVQLYHNYSELKDAYVAGPIDLSAFGFGVVRIPHNQNFLEERYDLELQHTLAPFQNWRFVWGGGLRLDQVTSQTYFDTGQTLENRVARLFGNGEWRAAAGTIVNGGVMLEYNQLSGTDWLPRLAVNQHLAPGHTVRVVASRASRAPTLFEEKSDYAIYYQGILLRQQNTPSAGLTAEKMDSYELGYLWTQSRELAVDVRLFRDRLYNLITEIYDPSVVSPSGNSVFTYRNEGSLNLTGAEVEMNYRPTRSTRIHLAYASMRADASGLSPEATVGPGQSENSVPVYSLSALVTQRLAENWLVSVAGYWVAPIEWLGDGDRAPEYSRIDLRLAREFRIGSSRGDVAMVLQNLGKPIIEFDGEREFDRRGYLTVRLAY